MIKKQYVGYFSILFSFLFPYIFEKAFFDHVNFDMYLWFLILLLFISLHFFLSPKKIWEFVYKKRWFLCGGILIFVLLMEYNTSSIGIYGYYVQPNLTNEAYEPVFGSLKPIRSDEWGSSTPLKITQYKLEDKFSVKNDIIMAKENIVTFYPNLPTKSISVLTMPRYWGYLLFNEAKGLTVDTMFEWIILGFVSFEFMMIITKQKKIYSLAGAIILTFAPAVIWWTGYNTLLYGEAIVVMVNSFVHSKSKWSKLLKTIIIGWLISCDIMTMYPAWLIPFTYIYFIIVMVLLFKNTKKEEIGSTIMYIALAFIIGIALILPGYIYSKEVYEIVNHTVYPGQRFSVGGIDWNTLFNYFNSLFLWYKPTANCSEQSQFVGLFPLPLLLGLGYSIKKVYEIIKEKNKNIKKEKFKNSDFILILLTFLCLVFTVNAFFAIPWLSKITLLSYSPTSRLTVAINYLSLIILFRYLSTLEKKDIKLKTIIFSIIIGLLISLLAINIFKNYNSDYMTFKTLVGIILIFVPLFIMAIMNYYKTNYIFFILLGLLSFTSGIMVNPISKGVEVLHEKPLAKKITEIVNNDPDSIWITLNNSFVIGNYIAANGARTINTTNMVPNLKLWEKFDSEGKYTDVYNRYAYFMIYETDQESYLYLNQQDLMTLYLNLNDLDRLGVNYIVSSTIINDENLDNPLKLLYSEDGQNIYQVIYE